MLLEFWLPVSIVIHLFDKGSEFEGLLIEQGT
jgi:hypothetical protein